MEYNISKSILNSDHKEYILHRFTYIKYIFLVQSLQNDHLTEFSSIM